MPCVNMHGTFEGYKYGVGVVCRRGEQQEGKGRKRKENFLKEKRKERKEREEKKREREREESKRGRRRKGKRSSDGQNSSDPVRIFDEGCAPRGRDSSYLGFFLSFELLFLSSFRTTLCHVYGMFCGIN